MITREMLDAFTRLVKTRGDVEDARLTHADGMAQLEAVLGPAPANLRDYLSQLPAQQDDEENE